MKKLKLITAALVFGVMAFSCSDDDDSTPDNSCTTLTANTAAAAQAYNNATDADFVAKCNAYKAALQAQITGCGDASGALQLMVDNLGDCSLDTTTGSITVTAGSSPRNFNSNISVTTTGTTIHVYAEEASSGYYIEFDIAQGATGADAITNFNIHLITTDYYPLPDADGGNWTSNITVNSATEINGTFYGYVTSSSNAVIDLTSGMINIDL